MALKSFSADHPDGRTGKGRETCVVVTIVMFLLKVDSYRSARSNNI